MKIKKTCAISIDLDEIYNYYNLRKLKPLPSVNKNAVYKEAIPRFLNIFDEYKIKATFFVVGKDARKNMKTIREIYKRGHEIANHTLNHKSNFIQLPLKQKEYEISNADKILSDIIGSKIVGFRSPGWGLDNSTLNILENLNYKYDSSGFPSKSIFLIALFDWLLMWGKQGFNLGNSWDIRMGLSPKSPYFPSTSKFWRRGSRKILEIPLTILPYMQIPFLHTITNMLGIGIFDPFFSYIKHFNRELIYILHGIELVDYYYSINDKNLKKIGIKKTLEKKYEIFNYAFNNISRKYKFMTMKDIALNYKSTK